MSNNYFRRLIAGAVASSFMLSAIAGFSSKATAADLNHTASPAPQTTSTLPPLASPKCQWGLFDALAGTCHTVNDNVTMPATPEGTTVNYDCNNYPLNKDHRSSCSSHDVTPAQPSKPEHQPKQPPGLPSNFANAFCACSQDAVKAAVAGLKNGQSVTVKGVGIKDGNLSDPNNQGITTNVTFSKSLNGVVSVDKRSEAEIKSALNGTSNQLTGKISTVTAANLNKGLANDATGMGRVANIPADGTFHNVSLTAANNTKGEVQVNVGVRNNGNGTYSIEGTKADNLHTIAKALGLTGSTTSQTAQHQHGEKAPGIGPKSDMHSHEAKSHQAAANGNQAGKGGDANRSGMGSNHAGGQGVGGSHNGGTGAGGSHNGGGSHHASILDYKNVLQSVASAKTPDWKASFGGKVSAYTYG